MKTAEVSLFLCIFYFFNFASQKQLSDCEITTLCLKFVDKNIFKISMHDNHSLSNKMDLFDLPNRKP